MIFNLIIMMVLYVLITSAIFAIDKKSDWAKKRTFNEKQIVIGIIYGLLGAIATFYGADISTAVINLRDAAPLCAGLIFGAPAGVIAGCIAAAVRYIAAIAGIGLYSGAACTIATFLAGLIAAALRKFMFDNKIAPWLYGLAIGTVVEVLHMIILFVTNINDAYNAFFVVRSAAVPMITVTGLTLMISLMAVSFIAGESFVKERKKEIAYTFQKWLVLCIMLAFIATSGLTMSLQGDVSKKTIESSLTTTVTDTAGQLAHYVDTDQYENITTISENRSIGNTGEIIIVDKEGTIVSRKDGDSEGDHLTSVLNENQFKRYKETEFFETTVEGKDVYCLYEYSSGYYVIGLYPADEAGLVKDVTVYVTSFSQIIVFALLMIVVYFLIKVIVVNSIRRINVALGKITAGNLNIKVDVRNNKEFASLSDDINTTVNVLKKYIDEAAARIDKELEFARTVQHSALPEVFPAFPNIHEFDIYAKMTAAKEVGGDFFDFYMVNDETLVFTVADVSDKGIPAAMFMMRTKSLIKSLAENGLNVDEVLVGANNALCKNNDADMFVTVWIGALNIKTGILKYANAGHEAPIMIRSDGTADFINSKPGFVLGGIENIKYKEGQLQLKPGDGLFLYTDGVTEATDRDNGLYTQEKLFEVIKDITSANPKEICDIISDNINEFAGDEPQSDDLTMLAIRFNG